MGIDKMSTDRKTIKTRQQKLEKKTTVWIFKARLQIRRHRHGYESEIPKDKPNLFKKQQTTL